MKIVYKIEFLSDWHIGSGLDAGADADNIVLKDENNLPYIPGKTLKGLLKDALNEMANVGKVEKEQIDEIFGSVTENNYTIAGKVFFKDAILSENEQKEIIENNLSDLLYRNIASTKINKKGVAEKNSLRTIQVTIPVVLYSSIILKENIPGTEELFEKAFKWLRYIGVNRNRGLGRCSVSKI
jgi:CRISPR/Cas system CSM-associated protein Csm3 (group 7 of RAMP superfamily)